MESKKYGNKLVKAVTVTGGSDGPTSVWIAGRTKDKNIFRRIRNQIRLKKQQKKKAEFLANLQVTPHTLQELASYITETYQAVEQNRLIPEVECSYRNLKAALVQRLLPELLGESPERPIPGEAADEAAWQNFWKQCREYEERAADLPEELFPMDYHYYLIQREEQGEVYVEMDLVHQFMGAGYTAQKGHGRIMGDIMRDVYRYYGVTEQDIAEKTERFHGLMAAMMET